MKFPKSHRKIRIYVLFGGEDMERVNCNKRRRYYRAQDREILINEIERLYHQGFSQNDISLKLDIPRGTISRWMVQSTIKCREPGEAGKIKSRK